MRPKLVFAWKSSRQKCRIHIVNGLNTYCKVPGKILKLIDTISDKYPENRKICYECKRLRIKEDNEAARAMALAKSGVDNQE